MENLTTVKQAFEPLNKRLLEFQNYIFLEDLEDDPHTAANGLITHVYLSILRFEESNKIYLEADQCEKDILQILQNLDSIINETAWSEKIKAERIANCKNELTEYLYHIVLLKNRYPLQEERLGDVGASISIDFQPKEEEHNFKAVLSEKEAAILTHYLEQMAWMPKYQKTSKGRLAHYLFKRDADNVRAFFSDPTFPASPTFLKDLLALKERMSGLIELIESDIKQAEIKKTKRK